MTTLYHIRPRPQAHDQEVLECVATRLLPNVQQWLLDMGEPQLSNRGVRRLFATLVDLLHSREDWDGYVLAKYLDESGWDPDAALVEVLHDSARLQYIAIREEAIRWVHEEKLELTNQAGDLVRFRLHTHDPVLEGTVQITYPDTYELGVGFPSGQVVVIPQEYVITP